MVLELENSVTGYSATEDRSHMAGPVDSAETVVHGQAAPRGRRA